VDPIMHEDVDIFSLEDMSFLATHVQAVNRVSTSPAAWFRCLGIYISHSSDIKCTKLLDKMNLILLHATERIVGFLMTDTTFAILRQSCVRSLTKLNLSIDCGSSTDLLVDIAHVGAFINLQELIIKTAGPMDICPNESLMGWQPPSLTSLTWDQFKKATISDMFQYTLDLPSNFMAFLDRCSFPSFRKVQLKAASANGLGTSHLESFLQKHSNLETITVLLIPQQFEAVVPQMNTSLIDLFFFRTVTEELVDLFHPRVTAVVISVDLTEENFQRVTARVGPLFRRLGGTSSSIKHIHMGNSS
jgi:hypothetical protein